MSLHSKQKQNRRTNIFLQFCDLKSGILLCTNLATSGLYVPPVDWLVQYCPPDGAREYMYRVNNKDVNALLFLRPEETGLVAYLEEIPFKKVKFDLKKIANIQSQLEKLINENQYLQKSAKKAFRSFVRAYSSKPLKSIFSIENLDLNEECKSFGFATTLRIDR